MYSIIIINVTFIRVANGLYNDYIWSHVRLRRDVTTLFGELGPLVSLAARTEAEATISLFSFLCMSLLC